jgi:hypothetical protein
VKNALAFENGLIAAFDQGGNQIPEIQRYTLVELLNLALTLKARVAELEGLGPLIEDLETAVAEDAMGQACSRAEQEGIDDRLSDARDAITAILKGGAL